MLNEQRQQILISLSTIIHLQSALQLHAPSRISVS